MEKKSRSDRPTVPDAEGGLLAFDDYDQWVREHSAYDLAKDRDVDHAGGTLPPSASEVADHEAHIAAEKLRGEMSPKGGA